MSNSFVTVFGQKDELTTVIRPPKKRGTMGLTRRWGGHKNSKENLHTVAMRKHKYKASHTCVILPQVPV